MTTTINNHLMLIEKVGGIEKAKAIVDLHPDCYMPDVFKYWSNELDDYVLGTKHATVLVEDLRTAIAQYDSNPSNSRELESDDVKDIRNHISPRTVVWDLASGEDWSAKHG